MKIQKLILALTLSLTCLSINHAFSAEYFEDIEYEEDMPGYGVESFLID